MIKLKNIIKEQTYIPHILYHATFNPLLNSIKEKGILPGGNGYKTFPTWNIEQGVYLADDPDFAGSLISDAEKDQIPEKWLDEIIILYINTNTLDTSKLKMDPKKILQIFI